MPRQATCRVDAGLYLGSAFAAIIIGDTTELATFRIWATFATPAYLLAAFAAACDLRPLRRRKSRSVMGLRLAIAVFAFGGAVLTPLAYEVHARAAGHARLAQAEVYVIEQAASRLSSGKDPYTGIYAERGLESRPEAQRYFAYLPLMLAFGMPHAFFGPGPLTDARVIMALVTVATLAVALALWPTTSAQRLRLAQVSIVLPSGALFMVTGGDDLPVLAFLLLGVVLLARQDRWAGPVIIAAALLKQTAWPVLFVLLVSQILVRMGRRGIAENHIPRRWTNPASACLAVGLAASLPFVFWQPRAFLSATVMFPLGLNSGPSFDQPPTLGSFLMKTADAQGSSVTATMLVAGLLGGLLMLMGALLFRLARRVPIAVADQALAAGVLMLALIATSPISRVGYLIYPISLLTLGVLLRETTPRPRVIQALFAPEPRAEPYPGVNANPVAEPYN